MAPSRFAAVWLLLLAGLLRADPELLSRGIKLDGDLTLARIIWEAERQLGVRIDLPHDPDNKSIQAYHQTIRLETLLGAVRQYYQQDGQEVGWTMEGSIIRFVEKNAARAATPAESVAAALPQAARPVEKSGPVARVPLQDLEPASAEESRAFVVDIDHKEGEVKKIKSDIPAAWLASSRKKAAEPPVLKDPSSEGIVVTAYPESAVAFINDAPSIVLQNSHEKFLEWQARMQGALQSHNEEVLRSELRELEKRLSWLKNHLP